jgi:hypothetical protein
MRCPVCRAEGAEGTCRRCKADLSVLAELEQARAGALAQAARCVAAGDGERALQHADAAHLLRADHQSWRLRALACLLMRDYRRALAYHRRSQG